MSESVTKQRGRPATGNALSDVERMRAYRARKKAQVLAERFAAGLPPPRPGRPPTRPVKSAAAESGAQARIAELGAANQKLVDEIADARRSVTYHLSELRRHEHEMDGRGTSLVSGKEPARKHREAALTTWATANPWKGKANVKTLRTNVSRAIATLEELKTILTRHDPVNLGYDVDLLTKTMNVLGIYKSGMGDADAHAAHALREAQKALDARQKADCEKALAKVFGTIAPDAAAVRATAEALIAYDVEAPDWLIGRHRTDRGYTSFGSAHMLKLSLDEPGPLLTALTDILGEMRTKGYRYDDKRRNETMWFGGLDDFEVWRTSKH